MANRTFSSAFFRNITLGLQALCLGALCLGNAGTLLAANGESTSGGINPYTQAIIDAKNELSAKTPIHIAVLPVTGVDTEASRKDIRDSIHNVLSSTEFELLKPQYIDQQLQDFTNGKAISDFNYGDIARRLDVGGLLLVELVKQDRVYIGAYASFTVGIKVQFYSTITDSIIWTFEQDEAEREGGVSANPLSMVTTAITSTQVLTDDVRYRLIDALARKFVKDIPRPLPVTEEHKTSRINFAYSNAIDSPLAAGKELRVQMEGADGMKVVVKVSGSDITFPLNETDKGVYYGSYLIKDTDKVQNEAVTVFANKNEKKWTQYRAHGLLTIE